MNILAIDIGNTNINIGLFVNDAERFIKTVAGGAPDIDQKLTDILSEAWNQVPSVRSAKDPVRDAVIVASSVKPQWTKLIKDICKSEFNENIKLIGKDIPLPIEMGVDNAAQVGTDRVVNAAAAFAVIEDAVAVADFGTAVTIDLVDEDGVFLGGVIAPGFEISAAALKDRTAKLPKVNVKPPKDPVGANTVDAINAGLYYSAVGLLRTVVEKYAEQIGRWPQVVATGSAFEIIKKDCDFVDSWVSHLAVRGVVLAYKKYLSDTAELEEYDLRDRQQLSKKAKAKRKISQKDHP